MRKKIFLIFLAVLGACVLFVPILSRVFLTRYALREAEDLLQTHIEISSAELQILEAGVVIKGIKVYHPDRKDERLIEVDRADIRMRVLPIFVGDLAGVEFEMKHPKLIYTTTKSGEWELSRRIPLLMRGEGEKRLPVNVDEIVIKDGEVEYRDGKVGLTTKVSDVDLHVTHVRLPTKDEALPSKFKMHFKINRTADFEMKGRADFLSPKISFDSQAQLSGLPLPPFAPYYDNGLPVRITHGTVAMTSNAKCENDMLHAPAHVSIHGLQVEPKQAKLFGFASNLVVEGLKNKNGNLDLDTLISGNIRSPQFHVMTDLTSGFVKGLSHGLVTAVPSAIGDTLKGAGTGVKEGAKSGLDKLKGLFH